MFNYFKFILFSCLLFFLLSTFVCAKQHGEIMLVLDMRNKPELTKHFHTTSDKLPDNLNTMGLAELKIAGGSQFSKLAFDTILQRLNAKKITVVDLRQESHGLLNSNAISWYGWQDAANASLKNSEIEKIQTNLLTHLNDKEIVVVNTILKKSKGEINRTKPIEYVVHQVSTEEEYVTGRGSFYKRLYIEDFHAPSSKEVDRFLEMVKTFPKNQWIYFHCRGGSGRTTTFMLMYDMLHNAKKVSLEDMLARHAALGGKDMAILPDKTSFKYKAALARLNFIKQFYRYAHENQDGFTTTYSKWLKSSSK